MKKSTKIIIGSIAGLFLLAAIMPKRDTNQNIDVAHTEQLIQGGKGSGGVKSVSIGEPLQTEYFEVYVNSCKLQDRVNTGNEFADLKPEQGTLFLILDVSFRNTDKETRTMTSGEVLLVQANGSIFKYEDAEVVMLEGWGLLLEQINPGITKRTKLVYKIPADAKGKLAYHPARSQSEEIVAIGEL